MTVTTTKSIVHKNYLLRQVHENDLPFYLSIRNSDEYLSFITRKGKLNNIKELTAELNSQIHKGVRKETFIFGNSLINENIGVMFSYSYPNDYKIFITIIVDKIYQSKGYGVIPFFLFISHLLKENDELYFEVLRVNANSYNIIKKMQLTHISSGLRIVNGIKYDVDVYKINKKYNYSKYFKL